MKTQLIIKEALKKASAFKKTGSIVQAKEIYEDIIKEDEANFDAHYLLGICYYELKDFENSIKSIQNAIKLNQNDFNFYMDFGNTYAVLRQYEDAISAYEKAVELDSNSIDAYLKLANCCKKNKDYKDSLLYFKKAIKLDRKCYMCYFEMADAYNKLYKYELCIFYLQKAISICPDFHEAFYSMAQCYKKMKNEKKMLESLDKTLAIQPDHSGANHLLASYNGETNSKYSSVYARDLFDKYADYFEDHLVNSLNYKVPIIIKEKLKSINLPKTTKVLDLGCGTGLVGKTIVDILPNLFGVDISSNMIEETKNKKIYKELYNNEINDFLLKNIQNFDLVIAADVFIYIGDLQSIFSCVKKSLNSNGYFIFTIEFTTRVNEINFQLGKSRRFSHSINYVQSLCKEIGFEVIDKEEIVLRQENKTGQKGAVFVLKIE